MKSKINKNYFYNTLYEILILAVPFITMPYVSRVLGVEIIGRISFSQSIVSYFGLFSALGTTVYGRREIAVVRDDLVKRSETFWGICFIRGICVLIALVLYCILTIAFFEYKLIYLCCSLEIVSVFFDISWFFQGIERYGKITKINGIAKVVGVCAIFLFVHNQRDVYIYLLVLLGSNLIGNVCLWFLVKDYIDYKVQFKNLACYRHLLPSLKLLLPQVAIQLYTVFDKTMIGMITKSEAENGYYEQAQRICRAMMALTVSAGAVIIPRVAYCWERNEKNTIGILMKRNFRIIFAISFPIIFGCNVLIDMFVPIYFGAGYDRVTLLIKILILLALFSAINSTLGSQYLIPTNRENLYSRVVLLNAVVNIGFNSLLIPVYGADGAAFASVMAEVAGIIYQVRLTYKEIDYRSILGAIPKYVLLSMIMYIVVYLLRKYLFYGISIFNMLILLVIGIVTYVGGLVISKDIILKRDFWKEV